MMMQFLLKFILVVFVILLNGWNIIALDRIAWPESKCTDTYDLSYTHTYIKSDSRHQIERHSKVSPNKITLGECQSKCNENGKCRGVGYIVRHGDNKVNNPWEYLCELHDITLEELITREGRDGIEHDTVDHRIYDRNCQAEFPKSSCTRTFVQQINHVYIEESSIHQIQIYRKFHPDKITLQECKKKCFEEKECRAIGYITGQWGNNKCNYCLETVCELLDITYDEWIENGEIGMHQSDQLHQIHSRNCKTPHPDSKCSCRYDVRYKNTYISRDSPHQMQTYVVYLKDYQFITLEECQEKCNQKKGCRGVGYLWGTWDPDWVTEIRCELHDITLQELKDEGQQGEIYEKGPANHFIYDRNCGEREKRKCIACPILTDGIRSAPGMWPWSVSIQFAGSHICGGSIINERKILTAAHCLYKGEDEPHNKTELQVVVGVDDLSHNGSNTQYLQVEDYKIHPDFLTELVAPNNMKTYDNDIAIIHTARNIRFSDEVMPVCLPRDSMIEKFRTGDTCYVTGWKTTTVVHAEGTNSDTLKWHSQAAVPLLKEKKCSKLAWITNNMICTGDERSATTLCQGGLQGASGGPLVCENRDDDQWYQLGIVSFGYGCVWENYFGFYTKVVKYLDFIGQNTTVN